MLLLGRAVLPVKMALVRGAGVILGFASRAVWEISTGEGKPWRVENGPSSPPSPSDGTLFNAGGPSDGLVPVMPHGDSLGQSPCGMTGTRLLRRYVIDDRAAAVGQAPPTVSPRPAAGPPS